MARNYDELAKFIVKNVGGVENVSDLTHCMTRLRFTLKDNKKANEQVLKDYDGILTVVDAGSQYQIVIGNQVPNVYQAITAQYPQIGATADPNDEKEVDTENKVKGESKSLFSRLLDFISGVFHPVINLIATAGIIKGLLALWVFFDANAAASGAYQLWNALGDGVFYFLPVLLGLTTANKIGGNPFIGVGVGLALTYPGISSMAGAEAIGTIFANTSLAMNYSNTFFNIPIIMPSSSGYATSVIPVIFATVVTVKLQNWIEKRLPDTIKRFIGPAITFALMLPVIFIVIGPVASLLSNLIGMAFSLISDIPVIGSTLSGILLGGLIQVFVVAGVHWGLTPIIFANMARLGYDDFYSPYFAASFAQIMVVLAIILKTKDRKLKDIAIPSFVSGIFGITEPAIYGVTLPRKKMFVISCIAAAIGGGIIGYGQAKMYQVSGFGIFGFASYIGSDGLRDLIWILSGVVVAMVIAFFLALLMYNEKGIKNQTKNQTKLASTFGQKETIEEQITEREENNEKEMKNEIMYSPMTGELKELQTVNDPAFAQGAMGDGVAIEPSVGKVVSPVSGVIANIPKSKHSIILISDNGAEVLIHVGIDTVKLKGQHFEVKAVMGQHVSPGDLLIEFDIEAIKGSGFDVITPILITNTPKYQKLVKPAGGAVTEGESILQLSVF